ncbi:MAG: cupin domain-containing protein, partial [Dehalococcoidia bacterium]
MDHQQFPPGYGRLLSSNDDAVTWLSDALGVVFKVWSGETGNALAMVEQPIMPEALAAPVHVHYREDEISYVLEGEVTVQLGERVVQASQGTLVFKPRGIPHTFWNQTRRKARLLQIFTPGGF